MPLFIFANLFMKGLFRIQILAVLSVLFLFSCTSNDKKKDDSVLNNYNGHVLDVSKDIIKVEDYNHQTVIFDNRDVTYIGGEIMKGDSVCVSYKGELKNGTQSIIVEFIPGKKNNTIKNSD